MSSTQPEDRPKRPMNVRFLDMDKYLGNPTIVGGGGSGEEKDPIDKMMDDEVKRKTRQLKKLELDAYLAQKEKEIRDAKGPEASGGSAEISPDMVRYIAEMPEDKRVAFTQVYATILGSVKNPPKDYGTMMLPLMLGFQRSNPDAGPNAMAQYAKGMSDQILAGIQLGGQLATQNRQPATDSMSSAVQLLETFGKMYERSMMTPIQNLIQELKPQASVFEQILLNPDIFAKAKEIGMFGGTGSNVQLEQFRNENNFRLEQLRMEDRRWQAQFNAEQVGGQQRLQAVTQIMSGPLAGILAALGDVTRTRVGGTGAGQPAAAHSGQPDQHATPTLKPLPGLELMNCPVENCGGQFYVNDGQMRFECPICHTLLADKEVMMGRAADEGIEPEAPPEHVPPKPAPAQTPVPAQPQGKTQAKAEKEQQAQPDVVGSRTTPTDAENEERVQGTGAPE